jgi:hypothetical protein
MKEPSAANANSIRPDRLASLLNEGEARTSASWKPMALKVVSKRPWEAVGWLEAEGIKGQTHEAWRPVRGTPGRTTGPSRVDPAA